LGPQTATEGDEEDAEEKSMRRRLEEHDEIDGEEEVFGEGGKVGGEKETSTEAVLERTKEVGR